MTMDEMFRPLLMSKSRVCPRLCVGPCTLGSETSDFTESRLMPRNSMDVAGPRFFPVQWGLLALNIFLDCEDMGGWDGLGGRND